MSAAAAAAESKFHAVGRCFAALPGQLSGRRLSSETPGQSFAFQEQQHGNASVGWLLSPTLFGQVKTARANERGRGAGGGAAFRAGPSAGLRSAQTAPPTRSSYRSPTQQVTAAEKRCAWRRETWEWEPPDGRCPPGRGCAERRAACATPNATTAYNPITGQLVGGAGLIEPVSA